jgi:hypothetical protein
MTGSPGLTLPALTLVALLAAWRDHPSRPHTTAAAGPADAAFAPGRGGITE